MGSEGFLTFSRENDVANMKYDVEFSSGIEFLKTQLCENSSQLPRLQGKELSDNVPGGNGKSCPEVEEGMPLQQRTAKVSRSGSSCSKRSRMFESEHSMSQNVLEESKDISEKLGSHHIKKKSQFPKQKSHSTKRGEKRNFKVPSSMAKYNSSSLKLGASISGSAYGGNNFFGLYGLKHDILDVTKLMDEPTLGELLRGTFDCPSLSKDKGKKTSDVSGSFLNSVRKACSLLQFTKSVQSQNIAEMDSSLYNKMSTCQISSVSAVESISNGHKEQSCTSDISARHKDLFSENGSPSSPLDFPLYQPKDVLERIALPPSKDLESLLLDVSKLADSTRNSNKLHSGKQVSRRSSLPAFPWSHAFGSHSRNNSDAVKLSTSRSTCQGKWASTGVIASSTDIDRCCFTNLDSFSYDQSLVPSTGSSNNKVCPSFFANLPFCQWKSSSPVTHSKDSEVADTHCPRSLEAAQTLCEIATYSPRLNPYGIIRLQKKTSHRTMKGKHFKPTAKLEEMPSAPTSVFGSNLVARSVDQIIPAKKPRVSIVENKSGVHSHNVKKGPCTQPSSKSSIPLPSKPVRDLIKENKHSAACILKELTVMHPADRILDKGKAYVGQYKVRKLGLLDWKREKDK